MGSIVEFLPGVSDQLIYYLLATVAVVFIIATVAQAMVMKLAVALCHGEPIGVLFGGFVSWTMALCGGIASTTLAAVTNDAAGSLGALLAAVAGSVTFLCLALRMSPVRAFGVYIIHTMSSGLVLFLMGIGAVVFLRSICEPKELIALQNSVAKQAIYLKEEGGIDLKGANPLLGAFEEDITTIQDTADTTESWVAEDEYDEIDFDQRINRVRALMDQRKQERAENDSRFREETKIQSNRYQGSST